MLRVLGTRSDGYHLLESLMVPVSLYDDVVVQVEAGRGRVRCAVDGPEKVAGGPDNLASAAARAVLAATGAEVDVDIALTKRIPAGAGLGGGSSDAAAILRLLPRVLGARIPAQRLASVAAELGADVPFFLFGGPAWATGIGERLAAVTDLPTLHLCVAVPRSRVNTAWAYANALPGRAHRRLPGVPDAERLRLSAKSISCLFFNDFERGVSRGSAAAGGDVARLLSTMKELGAVATVMSGSGSAVVGAFASPTAARDACTSVLGAGSGDSAFAVRVLARLPACRIGRAGRE